MNERELTLALRRAEGEEPRYGAWGTVQRYIDPLTGQAYAVKDLNPGEIAQMQAAHRDLTLEGALAKEAIPLDAGQNNVVPRIMANESVIMPYYDIFLDQELSGGKPSTERTIELIRGITHGLAYLHTELGRAYSDLKPDNVALDKNGIPLITDFGTATFFSQDMKSPDPRDNMGELNTRAPECFVDGSHPTERSDVYSLGALAGMLFTGRYVNQGLLSGDDPTDAMNTLGQEEANKSVRKYVRGAPRAFRPFLEKSLSHDPKQRYSNGEEAERAFGMAVMNYERSRPKAIAKIWAPRVGLAAAIIGLAGGGFFQNQIRTGLETRIKEAEKRAEQERQTRVIRSTLGGFSPYMDNREIGLFSRCLHVFNDEQTAVAAFLDMNSTYRAIQMAEGKTDYASIEPFLLDISPSLVFTIDSATVDMSDIVSRDMRNRGYSSFDELWEKAKETYEKDKSEKEEAARRKERERNQIVPTLPGLNL